MYLSLTRAARIICMGWALSACGPSGDVAPEVTPRGAATADETVLPQRGLPGPADSDTPAGEGTSTQTTPRSCRDSPCPGAGECHDGHCLYPCQLESSGCNEPRPHCPQGKIASREGSCWGTCIDTTLCASVPSPWDCDPHTQFVDSSDGYRCRLLPDACVDSADCDVCQSFCTAESYSCEAQYSESSGLHVATCHTDK